MDPRDGASRHSPATGPPSMAGGGTCRGAAQPADQELRIVMVGKTGAGKSATGNTILGRECFESVMSPTSMTVECSKSRGTVGGQKVVVVDTPGLYDTRCGQEKTRRDIRDCVVQAAPGPHVFLIVLKLDRLTDEEKQAVQKIQEIFGEAADAYSMVLFTRGDDLQGPIEDFVSKSPELLRLVQRCNHRCHVFNNKAKDGRQVEELLRKIRRMVEENGGSHYTNQMFQEAEREICAKQESILKEREEEIRRDKERVVAEVAAEFDQRLKVLTDKMEADRKRDKKALEEERKQMADTVNQLQRQGQQFIEEKIQMALDQQNTQQVRARESQALTEQVALMSSELARHLQHSEERQKVALQMQRMEMEREWNQREEARRQAERAQWERERRELESRVEQEKRRRQQEVEDRHRQEARREAESSSSVGRGIGCVLL